MRTMALQFGGIVVIVIGASLSPTGLAAAQETLAYGSISGQVVERGSGRPLDYANVVIVGTTLGAMSRHGGGFSIHPVPVGTYEIKASYVGFEPQTVIDIRVDADKATVLRFELKKGIAGTVQTITVHADVRKFDVKSSQVSNVRTGDEILSLPVDTVEEALAFNVGVVMQGGRLHVRGGRSGETSHRIDGVPVDDPQGGNHVNLGLMALANHEMITGGMDAEYGNASSGVVLYTTRSGGRRFEGNFRYMTDDYGRADKTYTNHDRLALGFGGPTPFEALSYHVSGEAAFMDGEFLSTKNYEESTYLGGLIKSKERVDADYRTQFRLDWKLKRGVKMSGELTLSRRRADPYLHNWTTEGYVAKVMIFPRVRRGRFQPAFFDVSGQVKVYSGPWYERAQTATYVDVRDDRNCRHCLLPLSENQTVRAVRVVDLQGRGVDPQHPLYVFIDRVLFEGFQNPESDWVPELQGDAGDTNKVYYNSAEHTARWTNLSRQLKWALTHTLSPKTFYEVKLSRLSFNVENTVDGKRPEEFDTGGKYIWIPGHGPRRISNVDFYTDPDVPFFVTANDFPSYLHRNTVAYLLKSDITTQHWKGHKVRGGLMLQYNDMEKTELWYPGLQREFGGAYGLGRNVFHNFNPEGSFYVQDQWQYEGMVVNAGVRYDFFSPGSGIGIEIFNKEIRRDVDRWEAQWSPRLGLSFPITDRDMFHFHYGRFIQFPEHSRIFASQDVNASSGVLGNPNLDPETSISYQAGVKHQFTNDISGQLTFFNKDYYGLASSRSVTDDSTGLQRRRWINKSYASSRGVEFQINKAFSHSFSFETTYTFSFADGVASEADFGRRAEGLSYQPTGELPLRWDQRHTLNLLLTLTDPGDWTVTTTYKYGSGLPWTPSFRYRKKEDPLLENSRRRPATHIIAFQGSKLFRVYGRTLRFFFSGRNLLDWKSVDDLQPAVSPNPRNAVADYTAYATETGEFTGAYYRDADGDGTDEFVPVYDPRVFGQRRQFRVGLGFQF
ncbi:MAG: TonB-dependent receptor domain-containing protein [Candidatus Krumholzibacteriia bacterium]